VLDASILIPSLHDAHQLETTLISILEHRSSQVEIIVLHAGHYDDPYGIGEEVSLRAIPSAASEMELLAMGWAYAQAPIIHTIAPGATIQPDWLDRALEVMEVTGAAAAVPSVVKDSKLPSYGLTVDAHGIRTAGTLKNCVGPAWEAAFYRTSVLEALGGFSFELDNYADLDVALWLHQANATISIVDSCEIELGLRDRNSKVSSRDIALGQTLRMRHQQWFSENRPTLGRFDLLKSALQQGSLSAALTSLSASADARVAKRNLPNLNRLQEAVQPDVGIRRAA